MRPPRPRRGRPTPPSRRGSAPPSAPPRRGGLDVAVVARGAHGEAIARDGLRLIDPQRSDAPARVSVHATLRDAPPASALVLAVKQRDLDALVASLPEYLARCGDDAVVLA